MLDYANDTEGYYIAIAIADAKSVIAHLEGRQETTYHLARYSDLDTAKESLSHVMAKTTLMALGTIASSDLNFVNDALKELESVTDETFAEHGDKPWVAEVVSMQTIFSLCKGFPKWDEGMTFIVVQDHSNCKDLGTCEGLEPDFTYTGPVV